MRKKIMLGVLLCVFNLVVAMDDQQDTQQVISPAHFDPSVKEIFRNYWVGGLELGKKIQDRQNNKLLQMYQRTHDAIKKDGLDTFLTQCDTQFYDKLVQIVPQMEYYAVWKKVAELATITAVQREDDSEDNERLRSVAQNQWSTFCINALYHAEKIVAQRSSIKFPQHFDANGKKKRPETEFALEWLEVNKDLPDQDYAVVLGAPLFIGFLHQIEADYRKQVCPKE